MGMIGSAKATLISRIIMATAMLVYVYKSKHFKIYYKAIRIKSISFSVMKKIAEIGIPSGLQFLFEVGAFCFATIMVGWLGIQQLAAHQIALSIASITYMIASGIGAAATVRVGNYYGQKDIVNLKLAGFSAVIMVTFLMIICALTFILTRNLSPQFFSINGDVKTIASSLLVIAAFFQLSDGIQVVSLGALRGIADVRVPTYITLVSYWLIALPIGYALGFTFHLGVQGVWYGLLIGLTVAAILLLTRFYYKRKKFNLV